jgi:2-keto-4-pentenoate hydratase/2-oxohepta-3-ene-1,7-dioic acid hydratase in catechol pathway
MKLGRLQSNPASVVVLKDETPIQISTPSGTSEFPTWDSLMRGGTQGVTDLGILLEGSVRATSSDAVAEAELGPAAFDQGKIICVGLNYRRHAAESGMVTPDSPIIFSKFANSITSSGSQVRLPAVSTQYDYEAELGVIIGTRVEAVSEAEALDAVLGYVVCNDLSARDAQFLSSQWLLGKSFDGFLPIGCWLTTADEIADPNALSIRTWVNGELRQDSNTRDMIFSVAELVSFVSNYMTLEPGDLIITGTPEGVVLGMPDPKPWLKPGDEVTVEIERLGSVTTRFVA